MITGDLLDILLVAVMLWLALKLIVSADLFKAAVLFITLSLIMALAWVRLKAPDIALAEAAIGAGITGVLLIDTLGHLQSNRSVKSDREQEETDESR
ncbi:MAG: DUF4040 domain-containing protein [Nitrospirae bacterium]|nr:DUF4040 domain-containing protein [Nitrospirota bacterium]